MALYGAAYSANDAYYNPASTAVVDMTVSMWWKVGSSPQSYGPFFRVVNTDDTQWKDMAFNDPTVGIKVSDTTYGAAVVNTRVDGGGWWWLGGVWRRDSTPYYECYLASPWGAISGVTSNDNFGSRALTASTIMSPLLTGYGADGSIGAVKVWQSALTAQQLANERMTYMPRTADAYAVWPCVGNTLAQCYRDLSGNGRTLTSGGTPTIVDGPPIGWGASPQLYGSAAGRIIGPGQIWPTVTL